MKKFRLVSGIMECISRFLLYSGLTGAILFACMLDSEGKALFWICRFLAGSLTLLLIGGLLMKWNRSRKHLYYSGKKCGMAEKETAGGVA